jgi:hypothetical protein
MRKKLNLPVIFILIIFTGFALNVINERMGYPFYQIYGWLLIILATFSFIIEALINGRFK